MIGAANTVKRSSQGGKTGDGVESGCRHTHTAPRQQEKRQVNEWVELDMDPDGPRRFGSAK